MTEETQNTGSTPAKEKSTFRERPTREGMIAFMDEAAQIFASWPKWKQEILRESTPSPAEPPMPVSHIDLDSLPTSLPEGWTAEPPKPGDTERSNTKHGEHSPKSIPAAGEKRPTLREALKAAHDAGGYGWDSVPDVDAAIREMRGEENEPATPAPAAPGGGDAIKALESAQAALHDNAISQDMGGKGITPEYSAAVVAEISAALARLRAAPASATVGREDLRAVLGYMLLQSNISRELLASVTRLSVPLARPPEPTRGGKCRCDGSGILTETQLGPIRCECTTIRADPLEAEDIAQIRKNYEKSSLVLMYDAAQSPRDAAQSPRQGVLALYPDQTIEQALKAARLPNIASRRPRLYRRTNDEWQAIPLAKPQNPQNSLKFRGQNNSQETSVPKIPMKQDFPKLGEIVFAWWGDHVERAIYKDRVWLGLHQGEFVLCHATPPEHWVPLSQAYYANELTEMLQELTDAASGNWPFSGDINGSDPKRHLIIKALAILAKTQYKPSPER